MQHLDEGTIHSWLDGALSAEEAARVQAHVAECPQCAAAVAEARGFIAASSRILTALDHVPRGVVPAAMPVRWYNRPAWRAAAAVLVVAAGSLVVVRNSGQNKIAATNAVSDSGRTPFEAAPQSQTAPGTESPATTVTSKLQADISGKSVRGAAPSVGAQERARDDAVDTAVSLNAAAAPQVAGAATAAPQAALLSRTADAATFSTAAEPRLKVVDTSRAFGRRVTVYEVAPGDTVTLSETSTVRLEAMVVTSGAGAEPQARRAAAKSAATAPMQTPSPSPAAQPVQVEVTNGVTTINWSDAATGNTLSLSGHMPVERLREIKLRIERERAGGPAAARKKR